MKNSYLQQWRGCNCLVTICVIINYTRQPSKLQNYKKGWMFVSGWKWCKSKDVLIIPSLLSCSLPVSMKENLDNSMWKNNSMWNFHFLQTNTYISHEISKNVLSKNNFSFSKWNKFKFNDKDAETTSDIVQVVLLG